MSAGTSAAFIAVSAARKQQELMAREEEQMTRYTPDELDDGWEFKIVRANTAAFRKPGELDKLIREESRAGWVLVEKFDDHRVRFKRPSGARAQDRHLPSGIDPYRTHYGMPSGVYLVLVLAITLVVTVGLGGAVFAFTSLCVRF